MSSEPVYLLFLFFYFPASPLPHFPKKGEIAGSYCLPKRKLLETSSGHLAVLLCALHIKYRSCCKLMLWQVLACGEKESVVLLYSTLKILSILLFLILPECFLP